ncbi:hypothetical protein PLICRDRAFT_42871 [Plicaturopsis crispa FD-325 SS-3]|nr:hypothetical protein PLICRDRAFT_42871 [Plicaturopsis crispa FD-325 SS-3]
MSSLPTFVAPPSPDSIDYARRLEDARAQEVAPVPPTLRQRLRRTLRNIPRSIASIPRPTKLSKSAPIIPATLPQLPLTIVARILEEAWSTPLTHAERGQLVSSSRLVSKPWAAQFRDISTRHAHVPYADMVAFETHAARCARGECPSTYPLSTTTAGRGPMRTLTLELDAHTPRAKPGDLAPFLAHFAHAGHAPDLHTLFVTAEGDGARPVLALAQVPPQVHTLSVALVPPARRPWTEDTMCVAWSRANARGRWALVYAARRSTFRTERGHEVLDAAVARAATTDDNEDVEYVDDLHKDVFAAVRAYMARPPRAQDRGTLRGADDPADMSMGAALQAGLFAVAVQSAAEKEAAAIRFARPRAASAPRPMAFKPIASATASSSRASMQLPTPPSAYTAPPSAYTTPSASAPAPALNAQDVPTFLDNEISLASARRRSRSSTATSYLSSIFSKRMSVDHGARGSMDIGARASLDTAATDSPRPSIDVLSGSSPIDVKSTPMDIKSSPLAIDSTTSVKVLGKQRAASESAAPRKETTPPPVSAAMKEAQAAALSRAFFGEMTAPQTHHARAPTPKASDEHGVGRGFRWVKSRSVWKISTGGGGGSYW